MKNLKILSILLILISLNACTKLKNAVGYEPVDLRKEPLGGKEKAIKNVEEGRGVSLKQMVGGGEGGKTTYEFSTSNPMWRSSLEILDALPLSTVDYSGGLIITDWYSDSNSSNDSIKIMVRFLSNQVRSDSLKIIVHKKLCVKDNCVVKKIDSEIQMELRAAIIRKAAILEAEAKINQKKKKKNK